MDLAEELIFNEEADLKLNTRHVDRQTNKAIRTYGKRYGRFHKLNLNLIYNN